MEGMGLDLFATKGLEYVLVIGYLLLLVVCRRMVGPRREQLPTEEPTTGPPQAPSFVLQDGLHFHQGHAWARATGNGVMRLGIDDFAQNLLGTATGVVLPRIGAQLAEGEPGWKIRVGGKSILMLSPVEGEVVRWNEEALRSPGLVNREPYDGGWLLEVRVRSPEAAKRNLLSGRLARAWMDGVVERLGQLSNNGVGITSVGHASPEDGLARALAPGGWERLVSRFLLTDEVVDQKLHDASKKQAEGQDRRAQPA